MNIKAGIIPSSYFEESYPEFLQKRMDQFFIERWGKLWGGKHILRGKIAGNSAVEMLSNDYLSISGHPDILEAQMECMKNGEQSVVMSGAFLRGDNPQKRFERKMADFCGYESAILCQSGYAANVGLIQSIACDGVPVYMDINAHASLWEGVHSAGAQARPFRHNDLHHLERQLKAYGRGLVCVDSVYSTMGSVCRLPEVVEMAKRYGCLVLVDESHSLGTHGPSGAGMVRGMGLEKRVDFITASLAKAFCGRAGLILCSRKFADYFWVTSLPAIFSSCLLPHEIASLDKTLDVIALDDWRREALHANADYLRGGLAEMGYNTTDSQSQIISLESGPEDCTLKLREELEERDVFGSVFCAPATAKNRSMIRFSVNAALTREQLDHVLRVCCEIRELVGMQSWASTRRLLRKPAKRQGSKEV